MVTYLIKSTLCLTLFLAFYHLVLEREKMHRFNRFYLLSAVFISFLAPLYTIYIKVIQEPIAVFTQLPDENITFTQEIVATETPINYWNYAIYFSVFISVILLIRFLKNLYAIYKKVSISDKFKHQNATIVLVADEILPHTFWNYIFINKATYESKEVEQELFTHELTHVAQKHTFDVLFVELLKVVFWFNPIFYFLKKSVQLNHEFLADTKVVTQHKNVSKYQHLLINTSAWSNEYALASNLHYLVTKKRIIMMTKQTSKAVIVLKKVAVLPLVIGAFFLFAERVEAQESVETIVENVPFNSVKTEDFDLYKEYYYKKLTFIRKDENGNKISKKYNELSKEEKERLAPPALNQKEKTPSKELIENLKDNKKYALWIDGKVVKNTDLSNYKNIDFSDYFVSFVYKNARSKRFPQEYQANLSTKKYFETQNKKRKEDFLNWVKKEHNIKEIKIKSSENKTYINKSTPEYKYTKQTYWIKDKNGKKVAKKYYELSDYYKKKWLIFPPNPKGEKAITTSEFNSLKDALNYVVRINGVVINNNELANYTTNNFVSFSKSKISSLAKLKQQYHYNLITKKGFKLLKSLENSINKIRRNSSKQSIASESVVEDIKFKLNNADVLNLSLTSKDTILPPPPPKRTSTKIVKKGEKSNIPPPPSPMVKKGEISNIPPPRKTGQIKFKRKNDNQETVTIDKINDLTNKQIIDLPKNEDGKKATYYLDDKKMSYSQFKKYAKENNIEAKSFNSIRIERNKDGTKSMFITTKKEKTASNIIETTKTTDCLTFPKTINFNKNEKYTIQCLEKHPNNSLEVFNRWGNTVFSIENYTNDWNGKFKDKKLKTGTYYYVFKSDKLKKPIKGWLYVTE